MAGCGMGIIKRLMGNSVRRHYRARGYQVFRGAFPKDQISAIGDMVHRLIPGYSGELRRQDGRFATNDFFQAQRWSVMRRFMVMSRSAPALSLCRTRYARWSRRRRSLIGCKRSIGHRTTLSTKRCSSLLRNLPTSILTVGRWTLPLAASPTQFGYRYRT
jgi:hypothetical protein